MDFAGKVALVTGSTRGIGWATAERLAEHGATVVLNAHSSEDELSARRDELTDRFGGKHMALKFDVGDRAAVTGAVRQVFSGLRRLDALINNAGILDDALLGMIDERSAERTFTVNTLGTLNTMQASSRLLARSGGAIVNVASIIGVVGNHGQVAYGGSKAAVIGMTKSAAKELAPSGVRVNAVAPGFIDTDMIKRLPDGIYEERVRSIGMGRVGSPGEVARAIVWLASADASYVTGQVLGVDGGMLI
jgi:3-oxoacyl-[acyl-carrier protein] reductase